MLILKAWMVGIEVAKRFTECTLAAANRGTPDNQESMERGVEALRQQAVKEHDLAPEEDWEAGWMFTLAFHCITHDMLDRQHGRTQPIGRLETVEALIQTASENDWRDKVRWIRSLREDGGLPSFWEEIVLRSGLISRVAGVWKLVDAMRKLYEAKDD